MDKLPDDLYREIVSFINPTIVKYQFSVIWCNKCGELLKTETGIFLWVIVTPIHSLAILVLYVIIITYILMLVIGWLF